ncbi:MAG: DUF5689 domain-containing protein [Bacteroidales bacterium]|nr:DUF5689 domain-containing protein [Bacteroidales bacterium]
MKKFNIIGLLVVFSALFVGCSKTDYDPIPSSSLMGTKWETTYSIAQLKADYMKTTGLFSSDLIDTTKDVVINGIITSSDVEGNVYKYIVIQEEGVGGQAMKISIDAGSISGIYPLGQRVSLRCNGLAIGKYAEGPQMGIKYFNLAKNRPEPGRMPKPLADKLISAYGLPDLAAVKADTMTIAQIKAAGISVANKLVCIKNAFFTGKGAYSGTPAVITDAELIMAPSTNGVGYPQSREIQDGTGSVFVSTSEYSKFANKPIPESSNRGNITAIIGWYNDKDAVPSSSKIYHQLTLRSLNDLGKGFEAYHAKINK